MTTVILERLRRDLQALGVRNGDLLLVHSSLSSIGWVEGGAETLVRALIEAVGPTGTVAAPTLTGSETDGPDRPPVFDARETPCWTGAAPETLRRWPGARRSAHPTHSVAAVGARAAELIEGHEACITPCGDGSPYDRIARWNGRILFIGVDHSCNTMLHHVEELAESRYHLQGQSMNLHFVDDAGRTHSRSMRLHAWGAPRQFERIEPDLISSGVERIGRIGDATARLVEAGEMVRLALIRLARDPRYLLAHDTAVEERDHLSSGALPIAIRIERMPHAADLPLPSYATGGSVGMDLHAAVAEDWILLPGERRLVPTGLKVAIPPGYEAQVRPRSGLAIKQGLTCLNSPGTIDSDYRGECRVILINHGSETVTIRRGDRIAQMVIASVVFAKWTEGSVDEDTDRGAGGFGHTGVSTR